MEARKAKNVKNVLLGKVVYHMDVARLSSKGQLTIPVEIRRKLSLKEGDKVVFLEQGGNVIILNANRLAFEEAQRGMAGAAEEAGITSEQDVVNLVNEIRRERWEKRHDDNA